MIFCLHKLDSFSLCKRNFNISLCSLLKVMENGKKINTITKEHGKIYNMNVCSVSKLF